MTPTTDDRWQGINVTRTVCPCLWYIEKKLPLVWWMFPTFFICSFLISIALYLLQLAVVKTTHTHTQWKTLENKIVEVNHNLPFQSVIYDFSTDPYLENVSDKLCLDSIILGLTLLNIVPCASSNVLKEKEQNKSDYLYDTLFGKRSNKNKNILSYKQNGNPTNGNNVINNILICFYNDRMIFACFSMYSHESTRLCAATSTLNDIREHVAI